MVLQFKNTTKITDRQLLMCAVYVFRSLYLNFGRGTHHIYIILHVAVFNSLHQFEIAMFDFPLQFFTCESIRTSEFLRHTTISFIKLFKDIFLHSSIYFMFLAESFPHFLAMSSAYHFPPGLPGLPGLPGFAEVSWVCGCSLGFVRFDEVYWWHSAQST